MSDKYFDFVLDVWNHLENAFRKGKETDGHIDAEARRLKEFVAEHDAALISATLDFASRHDFFDTCCGCRLEWNEDYPPRDQWRAHIKSLVDDVAA